MVCMIASTQKRDFETHEEINDDIDHCDSALDLTLELGVSPT